MSLEEFDYTTDLTKSFRLNGWGLTAIDSLDTLILMERWEEVNRTINHVATLNFQVKSSKSV